MIIKSKKSQWEFDRSQHLEYFTLDTGEFEVNIILLRKANFPSMIPNPGLDCSYVVFNFWPKLIEPYCSIKIVLIKKSV